MNNYSQIEEILDNVELDDKHIKKFKNITNNIQDDKTIKQYLEKIKTINTTLWYFFKKKSYFEGGAPPLEK